MPDYDRSKLAQWARELGFVRDTLEKVLRLSDVLKIEKSPFALLTVKLLCEIVAYTNLT